MTPDKEVDQISGGNLQEGIFYQEKTKPGKFFGLLFFNVEHEVELGLLQSSMHLLWKLYCDLKIGKIKDLYDHYVPFSNLTVTLGFSHSFFKNHKTFRPMPNNLSERHLFLNPSLRGGGQIISGSGLHYADNINENKGYSDIVFQFTADSPLAINRCFVETWKLIYDYDYDKPSQKKFPLFISNFYTGYQREDHRSWLDFHDGVSNIPSGSDRLKVISIKDQPTQEKWTENGTYMIYMRLGVNLNVWRNLSRERQEIIIGRDKLTGCIIERVRESNGSIHFDIQPNCPSTGTDEITDIGNDPQKRESYVIDDEVLLKSHIQRVNHHTGDIGSSNSLRIFRQGYEFFEYSNTEQNFTAGLNFVSFVDTPERIFRILQTEGWLGRVNFGGDDHDPLPGMDNLIYVIGAGVFFLPPAMSNEMFPGSSIF